MPEKIKALSLVSYKFLPPEMGGQKNIAFFYRYLCSYIDLSCITVRGNQAGNGEGYSIKNVLSDHRIRYINPFYFFTLRGIIKKEKITHLIIEHPYYGWLGLLLKWLCPVKLVVRSHNIESLRFKSMDKWWWGILWHYEKYTHRNADLNLFIQEEDMKYAVDNYKLDPKKCQVITYGLTHTQIPSTEERRMAKKELCRKHAIPENEHILLFNGTLNYQPNLNAIEAILQHINPDLLAGTDFPYKIIICGNKLPSSYEGLVAYRDKNIIYAGFVEDINLYYKGADIFINPVIEGGGIKTKLVEALGFGLSVVSTKSGAAGISAVDTGEKMILVADGDWNNFTRQIAATDTAMTTPAHFFDTFYWGNIAQKAASFIQNNS